MFLAPLALAALSAFAVAGSTASCSSGSSGATTTDAGPTPSATFQPQGCGYTVGAVENFPALEAHAAAGSGAPTKVRLGLDTRAFARAIGTPGLGAVVALYFVCTLSFANLEQTFSLFAHDAFALDARHTGYVLGVVGVVAMTCGSK